MIHGRLARTSHQLSAAADDAQCPAMFSRIGMLDGLRSTTPRPSGRKLHWTRHFAALATKAGEICGLEACSAKDKPRSSGVVWPLFRRIFDPYHQYEPANPPINDLQRPAKLRCSFLPYRLPIAYIIVGTVLLAATAVVAEVPVRPQPEFECIGVVDYPSGSKVDDLVVGGLSGITYDETQGRYFVISDDRSWVGPARFFEIEIDLRDGRLDASSVHFLSATVLRDSDGKTYASGTIDMEGITLDHDGTILISSEGVRKKSIDPFVHRYARDGSFVEEVALPDHFKLAADGSRGVRRNLGLEALDFAPGRPVLFVVSENALLQDGPAADTVTRSPSRILEIETRNFKPVREYVYYVEPVAVAPVSGGMSDNGITDILVIDPRTILSIERSYSQGRGFHINLFLVTLDKASNVLGFDALGDEALSDLRPAEKTLVLDIADLGFTPDNIEGITFGPTLKDGRRVIILVADDNFNPAEQTNQIIALAVDGLEAFKSHPTLIHEIQGRDHTSPIVDQWVDSVRGIVTAKWKNRQGVEHAWLESKNVDDDPRSSEGVFIILPDLEKVSVGDEILVFGRVEERGFKGELTTTQISVFSYEVVSSGNELPAPVILGTAGRSAPKNHIDNDGLGIFEPGDDAIDFFESIEGMRVQIDHPVVVGPTTKYGSMVVLPDRGRASGLRSQSGGLIAHNDNLNPERLMIDDWILPHPPLLSVGQELPESIVGVVHYGYGVFRILNTVPVVAPVAGLESEADAREKTALVGDAEGMTIATFNVENLSFINSDERYNRAATVIADNLRSPDIIVLEEIQDDSGPADDGVVTAERTLGRLVKMVQEAGGPLYSWRQIDPVDGQDGGRPGANIRVALLFDSSRVRFIDRDSCRTVEVNVDGDVDNGPHLSCSPGRFGESAREFAGRPGRRGEGTRKPLVGEFEFRGVSFFVIANHFSSKMGDDRVFGSRQPRQTQTDRLREGQARVVREWADKLIETDPDARVVILGDFNDDPDRSALRALSEGGWHNLIERIPRSDRYSHVFEGNGSAIDQIIVSPALVEGAEIDIVHVNADYPSLDRASDHDPVVARLKF